MIASQAAASGAFTPCFALRFASHGPVTFNDPGLFRMMERFHDAAQICSDRSDRRGDSV
jgi:hypothetical protein